MLDSSNGPQVPINFIFVVCPWIKLLNLLLPASRFHNGGSFHRMLGWLRPHALINHHELGMVSIRKTAIPYQGLLQPIFSASVSLLCKSFSPCKSLPPREKKQRNLQDKSPVLLKHLSLLGEITLHSFYCVIYLCI